MRVATEKVIYLFPSEKFENQMRRSAWYCTDVVVIRVMIWGEREMNSLAATRGFTVCYPLGSQDFEGMPMGTPGCESAILTILSCSVGWRCAYSRQHDLNSNNTFMCGVSRGGFMSHTLMAEIHEVFKVASLIGTTRQDRIIDFRVKLTATAEQRIVELSPANDGSLPSRC